MVFSSNEFLFFFLPLFLIVFLFVPKNITISVFSVVFYFIGEGVFTSLILIFVLVNYIFAQVIARVEDQSRRGVLFLAIIANLLPLIYFKYADFLVSNIGNAGAIAWATNIHLPLGISFFTFHALSYLVDVYRGDARPARRLSDLALYILLFPQLIAGPILRYKTLAPQLVKRAVDRQHVYYGLAYFAFGLGQKVLIADTMAGVADPLFSNWQNLSTASAWLAAISYTLQIYFDFGGYSNMAIGLAYLMGFHFPTNFNFPYWSASITDFWRRWHITLSTWFRDYVYVPLGGNRHGPLRTSRNLLIVFVLCGLWHGASWTFLVWGLYHGALLVLERANWLRFVPRLGRHLYAMMAVTIGWVLFRSDSFEQAASILGRMFGIVPGGASALAEHLNGEMMVTMVLGFVLSLPPLYEITKSVVAWPAERPWPALPHSAYFAGVVAAGILFILSCIKIITGSYSPFIYFRF